MKKNKFIHSVRIASALFAMTFMAFSCTNISDDFKTEQSQKTVLKIDVEGSARTVAPALQMSDFTNFKLTGKKNGAESSQTIGNASGYATISVLKDAEIELPAGASGSTWEFTLTAELPPKTESGSSETFTATTTKSINQGQNLIQFSFANKEFDYAEGIGNFAITFDWSAIAASADPVTKVTAVLQNTAEGGATTEYNSLTISNQKVTIADGVSAGTYRLKVYFNKTDDAQVFFWQEIVKVSAGITSSAKHEITKFSKIYTINYVPNATDATNPCPVIVTSTTDIYKNGFPTRTGYSFLGWYTDEALTKPFDILQITDGISLYAKWAEGNNAKLVTRDTIAAAIAEAVSTDKAHPTLIKAIDAFTEEDFTAAASALKAKEDEDDNDANDVYIALDFTETNTKVTTFKYFDGCKCLAGIGIPDSIDFNDKIPYGDSGNPLSFGENTQYITVSVNNTVATSADGVLFINEGKTLAYFPDGKVCENGTYTIPASVTEIWVGAFCHSLKIQKLVIGTQVETIYKNAFDKPYNPQTGRYEINLSVHFEDADTVWGSYNLYFDSFWGYYNKYEYNDGEIYNIQETFASEYYGHTYCKKTESRSTFFSIINEETVVPLTVTSGAGTDEENYNLNTEGFNTLSYDNKYYGVWFSIATKQGYKYHLYYCTKYTLSDFTCPEDANVEKGDGLQIYSSDGKKCYLKQSSDSKDGEFTAEGDIAYIKIPNPSYGGYAYLLIREEAPESSGGNEGGE